MRRGFLWSVLALVLLALGTVTVLSTTAWGLRWLAARAAAAVPGELRIEAVDGRLIGPINVKGLTYRHGSATVTVKSISLHWRPLSLLAATLHITRLELSGIEYAQTAPPPAARPPTPGRGPPDIKLPVKIKLDRFRAAHLSIKPYGRAPLRVTSITLAAHTDARGIHVARLTVASPLLDLALHGSLQPRASYAMAWRARWTARPPDASPITGTLDLRGNLKALDLRQHIERPFRADIQGQAKDVLQRLRWTGHVALHALDPRSLRRALPAAHVKGDVTLAGDLHSVSAKGTVSVTTKALPLDGRFALSYRDAVLNIDQLELRVAGRPAALSIAGRVAQPTATPRAALTAQWRSLSWPVTAKAAPWIVSETGQVTIRGTLKSYTLTAQTRLRGKRIPPGMWQIQALGNERSITLNRLRVRVLGGDVSGRGSVTWRPRLAWRLALQGTGLDPAAAWPDYPGKLGFAATTTGEKTDRGLAARLNLERINGKLRGYPLDGHAHMELSGARLNIHDLTLRSGKTTVDAAGTVGEQWDLSWSIDSTDLHALYPKVRGALAARGRLDGARGRPRIQASLKGGQLAYADYRLSEIQGALDVDLAQRRPSDLTFKGRDLRFKHGAVDFIYLTGNGTVGDHRLTAALYTGRGVVNLAVGGGYREGAWRGAIKQLDLVHRDIGYWHLDRAVPVTLARDRVQIEQLCWRRTDARLCGRGTWRKGGKSSAELHLEDFQLQWLQSFVSSQFRVSGRLDAGMTAQLEPSGIRGQARLSLSRAAADTTLPDGSPLKITVTQGAFEAKTEGQAIHATLRVAIANGGDVSGDLTIPLSALPFGKHLPAQPPRIKGHLTARLTDLKAVSRFVPTVEDTRGVLSAAVDVQGPLAQPNVSGHLEWRDGEMTIPRLGLHLTKVSITAKSDNGKSFTLTGSAQSGGGTARISADGRLPYAGDQSMTIKVHSDRFEVVRIPEAQALATADITLTLTPNALAFSGNVLVPEAKLQPRDLSSAVQPSDDVVITNGPAGQPKPPVRAVSGSIQIILGDRVSFKGFGLTAQVRGNLTVSEQPKQPTLGFGTLEVTGNYKAYGQNLAIEQGRLSFVGSPIDNPGLNIKAVRQVADVTAGINVQGTLKNPRLAIFSNPAMDDANALSYLILGRPINQASTNQGNELAAAATSLGLSGGGFLAKKIGKMFGIENVQVESGTNSQTPSLVLGKYLTPDLYLSYGFGLLQPLNVVQLRYQISKHWELKAQSGLYNGGDILYTIDTH